MHSLMFTARRIHTQRLNRAGLHVPTAAKRGVYAIHQSLVIKVVGQLASADARHLEQSLREWFGL